MAKKKQAAVASVEENPTAVEQSTSQPDNNLPVPAEDRELVVIDDEIDDEIVRRIIEIGDEEIHWLRNSTGGFKVSDDDTRREIVGVITSISNYLISWNDGAPERMEDPGAKDLPPGFERRADCKLTTKDGYRVGISIPGASLRKNFAGYLKKLANDGLRPCDVWTKFRCSERTGKDKAGSRISFPFVEAIALDRVEPVPF